MRDLKNVSRSEVYRYMGFKDETPEMHILDMAEGVIREVADAALPKFCAIDTAVSVTGNKITFDTFSVQSESLARHFSGVESAIIFAATLGSSVDMLIYKYSLMSPAKAIAAQAVATAMIEMYADDICDVFASEEKEQGMYITPRFSPGYGDLSLDCQADFLSTLSADKRIGLCLTDADILTPIKSITAVVGRSNEEFCKEHKCTKCSKKECAYRN